MEFILGVQETDCSYAGQCHLAFSALNVSVSMYALHVLIG